ncbi:hypothetical protein N9P49_01055 [bacterium]|nr:hypothetical protein [bacterium]
MITINIEPADNGVVKFLLDDNINGGGEEHVARRVYDFECSSGRYNQVKFLNDLTLDLGMEIGTDLDVNKVSIQLGWGNLYTPTQPELLKKIESLERDLKKYKALLIK